MTGPFIILDSTYSKSQVLAFLESSKFNFQGGVEAHLYGCTAVTAYMHTHGTRTVLYSTYSFTVLSKMINGPVICKSSQWSCHTRSFLPVLVVFGQAS